MTKITQSELKKLVTYNPETGIFTWRNDGLGHKAGDTVGSHTVHGYLSVQINNRFYYLHRLAVLYMTGKHPSACVDHRNCTRSDNRIANLREATRAQNRQNLRKAQKNRKNGLPLGVYKGAGAKFVARISHNHQQHHLGSYGSITEAAAAYQTAKQVLHSHYS